MNYSDIIQSLQAGDFSLNESPQVLDDELKLQADWFSGRFGNQFQTLDGRSVEITQFGFWNRSAGPDFLHCAAKIDGVAHVGPLEIDLSIQHWFNHKHDQNPNFNEVILHVIFQKDDKERFVKTHEGKFIPTVFINLSDYATNNSKQPENSQLSFPGRCSTPFAGLSKIDAERSLFQVFKHRSEIKAKRSRQLVKIHGKEQGLWIALAETLGYKANTFNFHMLAQRIPIKELTKYGEEEILAILFGASDFLAPKLHQKAEPDSQAWIESLWDLWWSMRQRFEFDAEKRLKWNFSGVRPANHPQRRIAALAHVASHWGDFVNHCKIDGCVEYLQKLNNEFWSRHYTLTSKKSSNNIQLIGKSRAETFLMNHILPERIAANCDKSLELVSSLKAPAASDKVRRAADRLLGEHPEKSKLMTRSWHHQALIQVHDDFCLSHIESCEDCPFPEQLLDWAARQEG